VPERQRILQNTLDWSFSLLSPGEQALFACLGGFSPARSACPPPRRSGAMLALPGRRTRPDW